MKPQASGKSRRGFSRPDYVNDDRRASPAARAAQQQLVSTVFFTTTSQSDLDQFWFHKHTSRDEAVEALTHAHKGAFVVRPSSQRSCYALSWLDENGVVRHNLIYNQFPGFSLETKDTETKKVFPTLTDLVRNCPFLTEGLPEKNTSSKKQQTGDEMIDRMLELLRENDESLESISWVLSTLENAHNFQRNDNCEKRTFISFCRKEFCAPQHFKLQPETAEVLFEAISSNTRLKTLILKGHFGFMRANFAPHISDAVLTPLCNSLLLNSSLTHLDLSNNAIGNAGATVLAELVQYSRTLKVLNLKNNFIGRDGLIALAKGLIHNKTLDEVVLGQQFWRGHSMGRDINVSNDHFSRAIVNLIEDTYKRKQEILQPFLGTTYFHGFLAPSEAEKRLENMPNGAFLLYLNQHRPAVVMLCFKNSNMHQNDPSKPFVIFHKAIYRVDYGYSFTAQRASVVELTDTIGWLLLAKPELRRTGLETGALGEDLQDRFVPMWDLHPVWGLRAIPSPEEGHACCADAFPTLQTVVNKNRSFLITPVPRPAVPTLSTPSNASGASSSTDTTAALSQSLMYNCKLSN